MPTNDNARDAEDLLAALKLIAERAGKEILAYYVAAAEGDGPEVREKADATPVTEADEAAEAFILEGLAKLTPDIPVVSEEAAAAGHTPDVSGGRFWLVDPLDGTREFLSRNGEFTVNIALVEDGRPVAGVVHAPALAMTWTGAL
ncbi:MAG TPA: inositol monophosphatase family protein, partial [Kiloniellales bacterium]